MAPPVIGELRELARAHAPEAIKELARLAVKAKGQSARISAIRQLLDRGFGKPTQFLAADSEIISKNSRQAATVFCWAIACEDNVIIPKTNEHITTAICRLILSSPLSTRTVQPCIGRSIIDASSQRNRSEASTGPRGC